MDCSALPAALGFNRPLPESLIDIKAGNLDFDDNSSVVSGATSMASAGKAVVCAECKQPEEQPSKPFVRCPKCRKVWHQCCLELLNPECPKNPDPNWACGSCQSQMATSKALDNKRRHRPSTSTQKSTPARPTSGPASGFDGTPSRAPGESRLPSISSSTKTNVVQCAVSGCNNPVFSCGVSDKKLCKKHDMEQRHALAVAAAAAAKASVPAPVSRSRPIDRSRLHRVNPEGKEVLKEKKEVLKRKRTEMSKGNSMPNADMRPRSSGTTKPVFGFSAPSYGSGNVASGPAARRSSMEDAQVRNKPKSMASPSMVNTSARKPKLATAFIFESPYPDKLPIAAAPVSKFTQTLPLFPHHSRLPEPNLPRYEQPPPQIRPAAKNIWSTSLEEHNRPNSGLLQGSANKSTTHVQSGPAPAISSTKKKPTEVLPTTIASPPAVSLGEDAHLNYDSLIDQLASEKSPLSEMRPNEVEVPFMPFPAAARTPELPAVRPPHVDTVMHDAFETEVQPEAEPLPAIGTMSLDTRPDAELSSTIDAATPDAQSEAAHLSTGMDISSPGTQLNKELAAVTETSSPDAQPDIPDITGPDVDPAAALAALNDGWVSSNRPKTTLELKLARGDFNEDELDVFLAKQANRNDSARPSMEQIKAQNWGYLDPKVAWPEEPFTDEQAAAKIKQIEARGGRKAQFGKIFTAQNLQEKAEKGLPLHCWQEKRNDESTKALIKRMEDLFGMENLGNLIPATKSDRLVMMERPPTPDDEPRGLGRRKKKNPPRIYPVHGAPNSM